MLIGAFGQFEVKCESFRLAFVAIGRRMLHMKQNQIPVSLILRLLTLGLSASALSSCCSSYKAAVARYTSTLRDRGKAYYGAVTPELSKELVLNDAALACLVDKDQDRAGSAACRCADGVPDSWQRNCSEWLQ